jgi:hypothetical protein
LLRPLAILVGGVLLSGCADESIPLKKVEVVPEISKDYKETRKAFVGGKGSSARMKGDPSGIGK